MTCTRCGTDLHEPVYHTMSGEWVCESCLLPDGEEEYYDVLSYKDILYNMKSRIKNLDDAREDFNG